MGNPKSLVSTHQQPERVYAMDLIGNTLVVATAGRRIQIWDTRDMSKPKDERESSLKFGTSTIACMVDGTGENPFLPLMGSLVSNFLTSHGQDTRLLQLRDVLLWNISITLLRPRRANMRSSATDKHTLMGNLYAP